MTDRRAAGSSLAAAILVLFAAVATGPAPTAAQSQLMSQSQSMVGGIEAPRGPFGNPLGSAALSALVPGAGQLLALDQRRGWAYLALEALGWVVYADRRSAGGRFRDRYRDLAWEAARLGDGPRVDGDFEFYERMASWGSSGRFDADPDVPGLQPEPDPSTFNGSVWQRARGIYSVGPGQGPTDPAYQAAVDYYSSRAYTDDFRWDWAGDAEALERYDGLIRESDERFRQATVVFGAVMANHLVSAVDAYVAARGFAVEVAPGTGIGAGGLRVTVRWTPLR